MGIEDVDNLTKEVEQQINNGIDEADVILFVVDTKTGLVPWTKKWPAAAQSRETDPAAGQQDGPFGSGFASPGVSQAGARLADSISVLQNRGRTELMDEIIGRLPKRDYEDHEVEPPA